MIIIAVSSQKGGVGKTTLSINLAHAFARSGRRTLLVDADPQGSVGLSLTRQSRKLVGFYDFLGDSLLNVDGLVVPTRLPTLSLVAAGHGSSYEVAAGGYGSSQQRVNGFFRGAAALGFDICLVDTAAGFFGITAEVLAASNGVLIAQQAEPLGIRSVPKMLESLTRMRAVNPQLRVLGVALTMVQANLAESRDAAQGLRSILPEGMVLGAVVPRDDLFIRASARGLPVGAMEDGAAALGNFDRMRAELDAKLAGSYQEGMA